MADINNLCRCCHAEGKFEFLDTKDLIFTINYSTMLKDTFDIEILSPVNTVSCICEKCKFSLQEAYLFKKQVLLCETNFKHYCQDAAINTSKSMVIKSEEEFNDDAESIFSNESEQYLHTIVIGKKKIEKGESKEDVGKENSTIKDMLSKKYTKKKKKYDRKTSPLISRQNIDISLIQMIHTDTGPSYICMKCQDKTFKSRDSVLSHLANYHTGEYKCPKCDHPCTNGHELRVHYRGHNSKLCKICKSDVCEIHRVKDVKLRSFACDLCPKAFKYKNSLRIHMFVHSGGKPKVLCEACGMGFNDKTNLLAHIRSVHLKLRPFVCDYCKTAYSAKKHLKSHIISKHLGGFCGDIYGNSKSGVKHEETDTKGYDHVKGKNKGKVDIPKTKVNNKQNRYTKPESCDECGKIFANKFTLTRHVSQKHNGVRSKSFHCDICNQRFYDSSSLYRHKYKKHIPNIIKDKAKCDICNRSYRNLEKHMISHTHTPFCCGICDKMFPEVSSRNHHVKYVHSEHRFYCSVCDKGYKERGALIRHRIRSHEKSGRDFEDMSSYIINKGDYPIND